ncbi:MAG: hypothetical protein P4L55_12315 [Syntrophobacteraceae bacterium]|nr:hypothetical protein [Syntrophobacteraceae bacterium]
MGIEVGVFWGSPNSCFSEEPTMVELTTEKTIEGMILGYVKGYRQSAEYVLGLYDPIIVIEGLCVSEMKIEDAFQLCLGGRPANGQSGHFLPTLSFFLSDYSPKVGKFGIDGDVLLYGKILSACYGDENGTEKISTRLASGIVGPLSTIGKSRVSQFVKCKLRSYILNNYFAPGGLWPLIKGRLPAIILETLENNVVLCGSSFSLLSADSLPKLNLTNLGAKQLVTFRIESGLVAGVKALAQRRSSTFSDVFRDALLADT